MVDLFDPKIAQVAIKSKVWDIKKEFECDVPMGVVEWASFEVERQHDPATYVPCMIKAWQYAMYVSGADIGLPEKPRYNPTLLDALVMAYLVKPDMNSQGVRRYNVSVGFSQKIDWHQVPRALSNLFSVEAFESISPAEWYREYEEIHPHGDGNGRTGSILWNWLNGTLANPECPPDVYDPDFFTANYQGDDSFD